MWGSLLVDALVVGLVVRFVAWLSVWHVHQHPAVVSILLLHLLSAATSFCPCHLNMAFSLSITTAIKHCCHHQTHPPNATVESGICRWHPGAAPKDSSCTPSPPCQRGAIIAARRHRMATVLFHRQFPDVVLLISLPAATSLCRSHQWLVVVCSARSVVATQFCCSLPAVV